MLVGLIIILIIIIVVGVAVVCEVVTIKELPFIYTTPVLETPRGLCEVHLNRLPCSKSNASGGSTVFSA